MPILALRERLLVGGEVGKGARIDALAPLHRRIDNGAEAGDVGGIEQAAHGDEAVAPEGFSA
jgi:hypothetical protein